MNKDGNDKKNKRTVLLFDSFESNLYPYMKKIRIDK